MPSHDQVNAFQGRLLCAGPAQIVERNSGCFQSEGSNRPLYSRWIVSLQDSSPSPLKVASTLETSAVRRTATAAASPTARILKGSLRAWKKGASEREIPAALRGKQSVLRQRRCYCTIASGLLCARGRVSCELANTVRARALALAAAAAIGHPTAKRSLAGECCSPRHRMNAFAAR